MANNGAAPNPQDAAVGRAVRLFEFLARSQQLKSNPPRTTDSYDSVLWFGQLPDHPAIRSGHREDAPEPDAALLTVERIAHEEPPEPAAELRSWLDGAWDDPSTPPRLRQVIGEDEQRADAPGIRDAHVEWEARWSEWAERKRADRPARNVYNDLFSAYVTRGRARRRTRTRRRCRLPVVMRHLGPQSFEEVPPSELAALLDHVAERDGNTGEEALRRAVLELLGLKRLTDNVKNRFAAVQTLRS
ncbi:hypothetical protein [Saccharothrix obliqua]|uniref:hypothetical protein n=1 Tax=Saccharothrix obliqua TaxID=2861747 RepID=UPI001C5F9DF6|nr:hypothetical protein [Saccharothrix obliqua]MBW4717300.1 hypothetical protein [Saccharothrix obliqua]